MIGVHADAAHVHIYASNQKIFNQAFNGPFIQPFNQSPRQPFSRALSLVPAPRILSPESLKSTRTRPEKKIREFTYT